MEEVIQGELTLGDSLWVPEHSHGFTYNNTDSLIWVIGGSQAQCFEHYPSGRILFATIFRDGTNAWRSDPIGYWTSLCSIDFLPIDERGEVHDYITDWTEKSTLSLGEMRIVIAERCRTDSGNRVELDQGGNPDITIIPNPTSRSVNIRARIPLGGAIVRVFDTSGRLLSEKKLDGNFSSIQMTQFDSGLYFIIINISDQTYVKKVVKSSL